MSQVIVTQDTLRPRREKTRAEERMISREDGFQRWRRNDITGPDAFKSAVGYAVLPVVGLWSLLCGLVAVVMTVLRGIFRALGQVIGGTRNLITGRS